MPLRLTLRAGVCDGWAVVSHNNSCHAICQVFEFHSFIHFIYIDLFIYWYPGTVLKESTENISSIG